MHVQKSSKFNLSANTSYARMRQLIYTCRYTAVELQGTNWSIQRLHLEAISSIKFQRPCGHGLVTHLINEMSYVLFVFIKRFCDAVLDDHICIYV